LDSEVLKREGGWGSEEGREIERGSGRRGKRRSVVGPLSVSWGRPE